MLEYKFIIDEKRAICLDDGLEIGECDFLEDGNLWNIIHTGVNSKYQGQGMARKLVELVIQKAKEFLTISDDNIEAIASRCGWSDPVFFARQFKRKEGITPHMFRRRQREKMLLP